MNPKFSRRRFLKTTAAAAAGTGVFLTQGFELPGAQPPRPGNRLNVAVIGCGGQGFGDLGAVASLGENIVALCDIDDNMGAKAFDKFPRAAKYKDFRVMLDKQKDIEAVVVATPDHTHAIASITAMRMGKHCYTEKPMTHDVWEARQMRIEAAKAKVATQMGNQGSASGGLREAAEIVRAGAIGDVKEIHVWTGRPWWPQNVNRPAKTDEVPKTIAWDLWLGTAPVRAFVRDVYHPFKWRGWWDFGTGALGDMACHTMNQPYLCAELGAPSAVSAEIATPLNPETLPQGLTITYEFPQRGKLPPCKMFWYERRQPPASAFPGNRRIGGGSGSIIVGSKGWMLSEGDYGGGYKLLPDGDFRNFKKPTPSLPRSTGHHREWVEACKGGRKAFSNFVDHASSLTETLLLGNVAIRVGKRIVWDTEKLQVVDNREAARFIRREYRKGWTL